MRHFATYSLFSILVSLGPVSVCAAPVSAPAIGSSSGIGALSTVSSLVPTSGLSSAPSGSHLAGSGTGAETDTRSGPGAGHSTAADTKFSGEKANDATDPSTTNTNAASNSGLLDLANDVGNIVGNTVETDTLSNNDGNNILDGNQIANIDVGGDQGSNNGNGNGYGNRKGRGSWQAVKW